MNTPLLTTRRLVLRKFTENDIEALYNILSDKTVNTFLPWFPLKNRAEAQAFLRQDTRQPMQNHRPMPTPSV